ncbi:thiosulfate oxidation carrier complex protein SoxZ [Rubrimonas sp.]|uniref:thiosulfate oxidation carrier complex protein SoxZ n=1 Tax=Rubrimonas sp. TaxID=2036015 RepID=UPI002FDD2C33
MAAAKPRIRVPKTAAPGEIFTIKTLISHPMESGLRKDSAGNPIPRMIINKFTCEFGGQLVFGADIEPSLSANPYLEFSAALPQSGDLVFTWTDDEGTTVTTTETVTVG